MIRTHIDAQYEYFLAHFEGIPIKILRDRKTDEILFDADCVGDVVLLGEVEPEICYIEEIVGKFAFVSLLSDGFRSMRLVQARLLVWLALLTLNMPTLNELKYSQTQKIGSF